MPKAEATEDPIDAQSQFTSRSLAAIHWSVLIVVLVAPLPFASVSAWAWAPLAALTATVMAGWAVLLAAGRIELAVSPARLAIPGLLFAGVVFWILVQMAPFTPTSWHHPVWRMAAPALNLPISGSITVDANETASALLRLLWYASIFWLALQTGRAGAVARRAFNALALAAFAYAAYGLIVQLSGAESVLWLKKTAYVGNLTSTFINRNSYAAYAGIGLISITAVIVRRLALSDLEDSKLGPRIANALNVLLARNWHLLLAWATVMTALILTNSRAGLVSSLFGLFAFLVSLGLSRSLSRKVSTLLLAATATAVIAFFMVSGDFVGKRIADTSVENSRARIALYNLTLKAIGETPLLGTGYGTYARIFQTRRPNHWLFRKPVRKAHNTYLENALELGIPAALALTLSVALLAGLCFRGVRRRRRDGFYAAAGVGVSVLVGMHSMVDFSLQIPAVTASYVFIMGIACAQSWSSRKQVGIGRDKTG